MSNRESAAEAAEGARMEPATHPDGTGKVRAVLRPDGTGHLEAETSPGWWVQLAMPEGATAIVSDGARWCWRVEPDRG